MKTRFIVSSILGSLTAVFLAGAAGAADLTIPVSEPLVRALEAEMARATTLQMEDLERPYFVQYRVEDGVSFMLTAEHGALVSDSENRQRQLHVTVRVGSLELDNTNFADGGYGGYGNALPLDDEELALRQAVWLATDREYKQAVETLTRKRAYLKDKTIPDRPNDFSPASAVQRAGAAATLAFDRAAWGRRLAALSGKFREYPLAQEASVRLIAAAQNVYLVNTDGTRLRVPDTGALLIVSVQAQAPDGMRLSDGRSYAGQSPAELPAVAEVLKDIEAMMADLAKTAQAEVLERYSGPVLFDEAAGAAVFRAMLADGLAARPDAVGEQRRPAGQDSLEHKLGTRVLPTTFQVWDDPAARAHDGAGLLGHYEFDAEGVPAARVEVVKDGRLQDLVRSRAPTRKLTGSNGHGRAGNTGEPRAIVGNLFFQDQKGLPAEELKREFLAAVKDEGLEYGIRVKSLQAPGALSSRQELMSFYNRSARGGGPRLGDPIQAWKVSAKDGSETPIRAAEFGPLEVRALKRILAAGDKLYAVNHLGFDYSGASPPVSVVAPAILLEEVELTKVQDEFDKQPILKAPLFR